MIYAVEKFGKELTWRAWHKLNPNAKTTNKETFDLKSTKAPPNVPELKPFKEGLAKLVKNVKFKERSNTFMSKLNMEIKKISSKKELIVPAGKTFNNYLLPTKTYTDLIEKEIQKNYKKEKVKNVQKVEKEHLETAIGLELEDRIFSTTERNAFITLKDHKEDFQVNPAVRLINPMKPDMGQVAMKILDRVVKDIRTKTKLKQHTNTGEVISWFNSLGNKKNLKFIIFDIDSFYPSITPELLDKALGWA